MQTHEGLTAHEEEYQESCAKAHLGAILFADSTKHRFFSQELMHLADPNFVPSPPESPGWLPRQKRKPTKARPRRQAAQSVQASSDEEEEAETSRDLRDMAALWENSEED